MIKESEIPRLNWPLGRWLRVMETKGEDEESAFDSSEIEYVCYGGEHHLPLIMRLVDDELSEPYSIFTYRYFVYLWPQLSFLVFICSFYLFCGEAYGRSSFNWVVCMLCDCNFQAFHNGNCVGTVVCKMGEHRNTFRGYIAMLVVIKPYRGRGIGMMRSYFLYFSSKKGVLSLSISKCCQFLKLSFVFGLIYFRF